jgi:hypothetical protein
MTTAFEAERKKKALMYTAAICGAILLMFFLISWKIEPVAPPLPEQMIEVNLGNWEEGLGEVQPLIKGERGPSQESIPDNTPSSAREEEAENIIPDDNAEADAAPVKRPVVNPSKVKTDAKPIPAPPAPKPKKPKIVYDGPGAGGGNNPTEDNGYKYQGTKPGPGDDGDPNGNKDSYGNTPGGKIGSGPRVVGNRKIIRHYAFTGDLKKATIYAIVKVSPSGQGTFVNFDKGSTSRGAEYATAIRNYLRNIQFDKSPNESTVQVQFNFVEN